MNKALVLSVPGTGTRFTMNYLMACLGYVKINPEELIHKPRYAPFCGLQHVNAKPSVLRQLAQHPGLCTVIPLRPPVYQFLTRAGENAHANRVREESKALWAQMRKMVGEFNHVFLPIEEDGIDRAARLMRVAKHLDAVPDEDVFEEIVTNWAKVGSSGIKPERVAYDKHGGVSVAGFNMSFMDEEMEWYRGLIAEYKETLDGSP